MFVVLINGQLQKRERTGTSFLYWLDWKSKHFNWNFTEWNATQQSVSFQRKTVQMGASQKLQNSIQTLIILWPVSTHPCKLSILEDIWRATFLPFSSSKCFYSWLRFSNLVDLSFEYLSFSDKRKTTILFPSPLTFLQFSMGVVIKRVEFWKNVLAFCRDKETCP